MGEALLLAYPLDACARLAAEQTTDWYHSQLLRAVHVASLPMAFRPVLCGRPVVVIFPVFYAHAATLAVDRRPCE